jgi:hypothetical protein
MVHHGKDEERKALERQGNWWISFCKTQEDAAVGAAAANQNRLTQVIFGSVRDFAD